MFPSRFFTDHYWPDRYFPKVGATPAPVVTTVSPVDRIPYYADVLDEAAQKVSKPWLKYFQSIGNSFSSFTTSAISGAIDINQVAVGTAPNTIGGSAAFTFDGTTVDVNGNIRIEGDKKLRFGGSGASDYQADIWYDSTGSTLNVENLFFDGEAGGVLKLATHDQSIAIDDQNGGIFITAGGFYPSVNNTMPLGGSSNQWSDVRSVLGTFTGLLTGASATFSGQIVLTQSGARSTSALQIAAANPSIGWRATGQSADNKQWDMPASGLSLFGRVIDDADATTAIWYQVTRSGATIADISFGNTTNNPTFNILGTGAVTVGGQITLSNLTASRAVFTDGSKRLVSNAITGSGNVVMSASPTLSGTVSAQAISCSTVDTTGAVNLATGGSDTHIYGNAFIHGSVTFFNNNGIQTNTIDGSDNATTSISGGGGNGNTRGGTVTLYGNEAGNTGQILIEAGNVSGGSVLLYTGGAERYSITQAGAHTITGAISASSSFTLAGNATIGGSLPSTVMLNVAGNGSVLSGITRYGFASNMSFPSGVTAAGNAMYSQLITANSAFTMATGRGLYIDSASKGAASTITTLIGIEVADQTAGGTNYAIYTGAGPVRFGDVIMTASGQESTGAGTALLGTNSPASTLTAPYKWIKWKTSDGSTVYVPAWK